MEPVSTTESMLSIAILPTSPFVAGLTDQDRNPRL